MSRRLVGVLALASMLAACGGGSDGASTASDANERAVDDAGGIQSDDSVNPPDGSATGPRYEVTVVNLTAAQPLSPPALIVHSDSYHLFANGQPASNGIEAIAEGGDNAPLLAAASADRAVYATAGANAPIGPGTSARVEVSLPNTADLASAQMSVAMMLVNTNDAIGAARGLSVQALAVGESRSWDVASYDAGTEINDEAGDRIPGPVGSGPGTDPARDDVIDAVLPHPGVVTSDDGLVGSALLEVHRWRDPVARVRVRRIQ